MKKVGIILAVLILSFGVSYVAFAVDASPLAVKVTPKPMIKIETDTSEVDFGQIDPDTPTVVSNAVNVTVKSNKPYDLSYTATDFTDGTNSMDISNLEYADAGSGSYVQFANGPVNLAADQPRGRNDFIFDYQITVPWNIPPETTYVANITYTAVQK